jgi:hypothetical protein
MVGIFILKFTIMGHVFYYKTQICMKIESIKVLFSFFSVKSHISEDVLW